MPSICACRCAAWKSTAPRPSRRNSSVRSRATRTNRSASLHPCAGLSADPAGSQRAFALTDKTSFAAPGSAKDVEEGAAFTPKFDSAGLVTAVVTDSKSGDVLMVAHMNAEALRKTIDTGEAHYFSRSRNKLWRKGESSGHTQRVVEMRVDCDQDAI